MESGADARSYNLRKRKRVNYSIDRADSNDLKYILDPECSSDEESSSNNDESVSEPIIDTVAEKIRDECPSLNVKTDKLRKYAKKMLKNTLLGELDGSSEEEQDKLDLDEKHQLDLLRKHNKELTPTLAKILNAPISFENKAKLLRYYEILENSMRGTEDYLTAYESINRRLPVEVEINYNDHQELENLNEEIEGDKITPLKVIRARLPRSSKKSALIILDKMKNVMFGGAEHEALEKDLKVIMDDENYFKNSYIDVDMFDDTKKMYDTLCVISDVELLHKLFELDAPMETKLKIYEMFVRMNLHTKESSEYASARGKLMWALGLPFNKMKPISDESASMKDYCADVLSRLNEKLYGMEKVKDKMMRMVNNRLYNPHCKTMLGLKGNAGLGKTAAAEALAYALNLPFERISLGGMIDASIFRGSDGVWVGSTPSIIVQILKKMTYANGVVLFDELDKLTGTQGKQIQFALLHITDYTQNKDFHDLYLNDFPHDLSNLWFMFAMNDDSTLDAALKDRLDITDVKPYSRQEKITIVREYLLPKQLREVGMDANMCEITVNAASALICKSASISIRPLNKYLYTILSKINLLRTDDPEMKFPFIITCEHVKKWLEVSVMSLSYIT